MIMIINLSILIMSLTSIVMVITNILAKKKKNTENRLKNSPFECGFDPCMSVRIPFSLRFFLIGMIFLIFDVEIVLILPISILPFHSNILNWSITSISFLIILIISLFHEWKQWSLNSAT